MITIAGAPAQPARIESALPQGSAERTILERMGESSHHYAFDSEQELIFELALRAATVDAARELDRSGMDFAVFRKSRCNPAYWHRTDEGGFRLKDGVSASEAIRDIYNNGPKYATECATAMLIVFYKAVLAVLPDALFDKTFPEIELMNWHHVDPLFRGVGLMAVRDGFLPGDRRYFINPDVDPETPEWQGENVIDLGDGTYYGHGIGIMDADSMITSLNENRSHGADTSAYLLERAGRPDYRRLQAIREGAGGDGVSQGGS